MDCDLEKIFEGVNPLDVIMQLEQMEHSLLNDSSNMHRNLTDCLCAVKSFRKEIIKLIDEENIKS